MIDRYTTGLKACNQPFGLSPALGVLTFRSYLNLIIKEGSWLSFLYYLHNYLNTLQSRSAGRIVFGGGVVFCISCNISPSVVGVQRVAYGLLVA